MKLIVGLGNPGLLYRSTRHNIGSTIVVSFARSHGVVLKIERETRSSAGRFKIGHQTILLAVPRTYMNVSGQAVAALLNKYKIDVNDLLVICDDVDLDFSRLRVRPRGSSGGHRGLQSIIAAVKSQDFCRLRVGIGRPAAHSRDVSDYVLSVFGKSEKKILEEVIRNACACCQMWVEKGATEAMNVFNRPSF